jgi:hypothetical protein
MSKYEEALRRGQKQRKAVAKLQDTILADLVFHIQLIHDIEQLETFQKLLKGLKANG